MIKYSPPLESNPIGRCISILLCKRIIEHYQATNLGPKAYSEQPTSLLVTVTLPALGWLRQCHAFIL